MLKSVPGKFRTGLAPVHVIVAGAFPAFVRKTSAWGIGTERLVGLTGTFPKSSSVWLAPDTVVDTETAITAGSPVPEIVKVCGQNECSGLLGFVICARRVCHTDEAVSAGGHGSTPDACAVRCDFEVAISRGRDRLNR